MTPLTGVLIASLEYKMREWCSTNNDVARKVSGDHILEWGAKLDDHNEGGSGEDKERGNNSPRNSVFTGETTTAGNELDEKDLHEMLEDMGRARQGPGGVDDAERKAGPDK